MPSLVVRIRCAILFWVIGKIPVLGDVRFGHGSRVGRPFDACTGYYFSLASVTHYVYIVELRR